MEIDASLDSVIFIGAIALGLLLVVLGAVFGLRTPGEYGPDEFERDHGDPTVTTIARNDLIAIRFFENQGLVAKARFWGLGDKGIGLSLKGDPTEYLLTSEGDWFQETRFRVKPDIHLMLLAGGMPIVTANRVPDTLGGWKKGKDGKRCRAYVIDCPEGRFELVRLKRARFALRRGDTDLGIAAMPMPTGIFGRLKSRIELPASLPLATRLFLAMVVFIEDTEGFSSSSP